MISVLRDNALTTLEALKVFLGLPAEDTSQDEILVSFINQASASVETELGRSLGKRQYTERKKGTGSQYLLVENYPIRLVKSIEQAGVAISPEEYDIASDGKAGVIYKDDGWTYYGYHQGLAGDAVTGSRNIKVTYIAGYILPKDATEEEPCDLPADLEGLVQEMVQFNYGKLQSGGQAGLRSFSIADIRWEWSTETPQSWQGIINKYRRVWL